MNEDERLSPLGAEMVAGLSAFCDALEADEPIEKRFTVRTVHLDLHPKHYSAADVKHVRLTLKASQALLAKFLGVSVNSVRSWEQGTRTVPTIACRFLDEIVANPDVWEHRLHQAIATKQGESIES
jgi:putative transcriptional regulator